MPENGGKISYLKVKMADSDTNMSNIETENEEIARLLDNRLS